MNLEQMQPFVRIHPTSPPVGFNLHLAFKISFFVVRRTILDSGCRPSALKIDNRIFTTQEMERTMKKKIAVAVDGSVPCNFAVRYAIDMLKRIPDCSCTLIHIQPLLSQYLTRDAERKPKAFKALQALMKSHEAASRELLEKVRDQMVRRGLPADRIEVCSLIRNNGVAEDLMDHCRLKSYDALCVGRRGISQLQEMIVGSVTTTLLEHVQLTPVWIVDGEVADSNILLAADGSPNSLRALDHLCFMLSGDPEAAVQLVHVKPRFQELCEIQINGDTAAAAQEAILDSDRRCIDDFYNQAAKVLEKNDISPDRLTIQTIENRLSTAGAVVDAAVKGGFGTIVSGRRGFKKGLFTGSVSRKMIQKLKNRAIWLVP